MNNQSHKSKCYNCGCPVHAHLIGGIPSRCYLCECPHLEYICPDCNSQANNIPDIEIDTRQLERNILHHVNEQKWYSNNH